MYKHHHFTEGFCCAGFSHAAGLSSALLHRSMGSAACKCKRAVLCAYDGDLYVDWVTSSMPTMPSKAADNNLT